MDLTKWFYIYILHNYELLTDILCQQLATEFAVMKKVYLFEFSSYEKKNWLFFSKPHQPITGKYYRAKRNLYIGLDEYLSEWLVVVNNIHLLTVNSMQFNFVSFNLNILLRVVLMLKDAHNMMYNDIMFLIIYNEIWLLNHNEENARITQFSYIK